MKYKEDVVDASRTLRGYEVGDDLDEDSTLELVDLIGSLILFERTEQGSGPPDPNRPGRVWVDLKIIGSGFGSYFRVRVGIGSGVGSDKNTSLSPIFSFESNPTLLSGSLSASLSSPPPSGPQLSLWANVKTIPNRYLLIDTSGGLNQQRTGMENIGATFTWSLEMEALLQLL
ncbi:uncharacterized protein LOC126722602 [Quercus robur]|uniref:uncharacterized protein LOC126722602 n=1 Tax=Quercus robur TaxID=38942 RepID=UPI00216307C6|nr:uncharacterized protein LOC126722602 [Quercus robur]